MAIHVSCSSFALTVSFSPVQSRAPDSNPSFFHVHARAVLAFLWRFATVANSRASIWRDAHLQELATSGVFLKELRLSPFIHSPVCYPPDFEHGSPSTIRLHVNAFFGLSLSLYNKKTTRRNG